MLIRDKTGGPLLQAEIETSPGPPMLMADNGRKSFEIGVRDAAQFYKLISATKQEVALLKNAGFTLEEADDFEAREG
jgi:hypothetical protein